MKTEFLKINGIPAIIWGAKSDRVIIAVHGNMSNKADVPIKILADEAELKGYQVLSFDLPEHGERKNENTPCKVQPAVSELKSIMEYAKQNWESISLFANSIGAYFSLMAYKDEKIEKALFLSPVVDMRRIIENMMKWFDVSEEKLKAEKEIPTPVGQRLYWDYYCFVKENPVCKWNAKTFILYGGKDDLCEKDVIAGFTEKFGCGLEIAENEEHYFHTEKQLLILKNWIKEKL